MSDVEDFLNALNQMTPEQRWLLALSQMSPEQRASLNNQVAETTVRQKYGYLAAFLDNPEIGPLLRQAASEGWTQERLQGALYNTNWWRTTSASAREWQALNSTDPAEAGAQRKKMVGQITGLLSQNGVLGNYSQSRIAQMAEDALRTGASGDEIARMVLADLHFDPNKPNEGGIGGSMMKVKDIAASYFQPVSDEVAFNFARDIATGMKTMDAVQVHFRNLAKSRYPALGDELDSGTTLKQYFEPYIQQTAQLLEVSPDAVDLTEPRFNKMIENVDEAGVRRPMTLSESATYIRNTNEYAHTARANGEAAAFGEQLLQKFGKVA